MLVKDACKILNFVYMFVYILPGIYTAHGYAEPDFCVSMRPSLAVSVFRKNAQDSESDDLKMQ